jgi:hypothetical protein
MAAITAAPSVVMIVVVEASSPKIDASNIEVPA